MIPVNGVRMAFLGAFVLFAAGACEPARAAPAQTSPAPGQTQPKAAPKKPAPKPIDPDETAGVRGSGAPLAVRVLVKGRPAGNAHVVVKNSDGSIAASCFTESTGSCTVEVGPDNYEIDATGDGRAAATKLHVSEKTGTVTVRLLKPAATVKP